MRSRSRPHVPRCSRWRMQRVRHRRMAASPTCWNPSAWPESHLRGGEEPLARLVAELPARDQVAEELDRLPALITGLAKALVEDRLDHVEPDEIGELERPHRPAQCVAHREVAVLDGGVACLHETHRLLD